MTTLSQITPGQLRTITLPAHRQAGKTGEVVWTGPGSLVVLRLPSGALADVAAKDTQEAG